MTIGHENSGLFYLLSLEPLDLSKFFSGPLNFERSRVTCITSILAHQRLNVKWSFSNPYQNLITLSIPEEMKKNL